MLEAHRAGITTVVIPRENRKDLREVPRRVLKATRVVLVEHMDEVLREALCIPEPDAVFGPPRESWEYIDGELVVRGQGVPTPRAAASGLPAGAAPSASVGDGVDGGVPAPTGNA